MLLYQFLTKQILDLIAKFLIKKNIQFILLVELQYLNQINIPHIEISKYTKQKEILDGRVKTLHPKIFGGILATILKKPSKRKKMKE